MNIIAKKLVGGGKTLSFLLAAMIVLCGAQMAQAAYYGWKGSSSSPSYWESKDNWYCSQISWDEFSSNTCEHHIDPIPNKTNIFIPGWDRVITFSSNSQLKGILQFRAGSTENPIIFVSSDNSEGFGITSTAELNIYSNSEGGEVPDACLEIRTGKYQFNRINIASKDAPRKGTLNVTGGHLIANRIYVGSNGNATFRISDRGKVTMDKEHITIGQGSTGFMEVVDGGTYENIIGDGLTRFAYGTSEGTLTVKGGTFTAKGDMGFNYDANAEKSSVNILDGGIVKVGGVSLKNPGKNGAIITIDGGTLAAYADNASFLPAYDAVRVFIGTKGATIDTCGHDIAIGEDLENKDGENGAIVFTGGGSVNLLGGCAYTGATAVNDGTALVATSGAISFSGSLTLSSGAKIKTLRSTPFGIKASAITLPQEGVVIVEFDESNILGGSYEIMTITGDGKFESSDFAKFELGNNAPEGTFSVSENKKSIVLSVKSINPATWTGDANDGLFSSPQNWLGNVVPGANADVVFNVESDEELTCDIPLNVKSITFAMLSKKVTITGSGCITNATVIVNNSDVRHIIDVPVKFKEKSTESDETVYKTIDVTGEVDFRGGVEGTVPVNHTTFYGNYTLTATSWTISSPITLAAGASVQPLASLTLVLNCTKALNASEGASLQINTLNGKSVSEMFGTYSGIFKADKIHIANDTNTHKIGAGFEGEMYAKHIECTKGQGGNPNFYFNPSSSARIVVGGGTGFETIRGYLRVGAADSAPLVLHSAGNWSFLMTYHNIGGATADNIKILLESDLMIDTSNYAEPSAQGFVVTIKNNAWKSDRCKQMLSGDKKKVSAYGNGTLKFELHDALFTGGLIAYDGVTVAVNKDIYPGKGDVTIKDTATLKLAQSSSGTVPVAGTLTMEGGSTINIPSYSADIVPLSVNGLAFANVTDEKKVVVNIDGGALRYGFNAILKSNEGIPADVWDNINLQLAESVVVPEGMTMVKLVQGNTLYVLFKGENEAIWSGGGDNANFNAAANWLGEQVPSNGASLLIAAAGATTLINDIAGFSPSSITFSGASSITIDGEHALSVNAITNLSGVSHTINVPVIFTGDIAVSQNARGYSTKGNSHIVFASGAYSASGRTIAEWGDGYSWAVFGRYSFANTQPFEVTQWKSESDGDIRFAVADDAYLYIPCAANMKELYIGNRAVVEVDNMELSEGRLCKKNRGTMVISNLTVSASSDVYATSEQGTETAATFMLNAVTNSITTEGKRFYLADSYAAGKSVYFIGEGGLNFSESAKGAYSIGNQNNGNSETIRPWYSDFTVSGRGDKNYAVMFNYNIEFNTTDVNGNGRTITLDCITRSRTNPSITVSGKGTLRVNKENVTAASGDKYPPVTVTDSATLAFKPGADLGEGLTTVNSGAAFQVAESGDVALRGDLLLKNGAVLGFNYTRNSEPKLKLDDRVVSFEEGESTNVVVKISAAAGKRAHGGRNYLTSGGQFAGVDVSLPDDNVPEWVICVGVEEGNIYADIKPAGMRIVVR